MLYHSVLFIGLNEMGPVNKLEILNAVILLICCAIINANLFGEIAMVMSVLERRSTINQNKLDSGNSVMARINLPD